MRLTDILPPNCVQVPLEATDKKLAITELVQLLADNDQISDFNAVLDAVLQREAIRSTGIGQGFAIPHCKSLVVDRLVMAVGKTAEPVDFDSIDNQPVNLIFLLVSPADQTGPHIQALARISRLMTDQDIPQRLSAANSQQELYQIIADHER